MFRIDKPLEKDITRNSIRKSYEINSFLDVFSLELTNLLIM